MRKLAVSSNISFWTSVTQMTGAVLTNPGPIGLTVALFSLQEFDIRKHLRQRVSGQC